MRVHLLPLLVILLAAPASAEERRLFDASAYGAVVGPLDHELTEDEREALLHQFDRFTEAMENLHARKWTAAGDGFEAVLSTTQWFEAAYNGALARRASGRVVDASRLADRATELRPDDHAAAALRASLLQARGRHADALQVLDAALVSAQAAGLAFEEALVLLNRGSALNQLGRSGEAIGAFGRASELGAELKRPAIQAAAKIGEGRASATLGDVRAARAAFDAAGALSSEDDVAELRLALARTLAEGGDVGGAREVLAKAVAALGKVDDRLRRGSALVEAAGLTRELGDGDGARRHLASAEAALADHRELPAWAHLLVARGRLELRDGDPKAAAATLRTAVGRLSRAQVPVALAGARVALARALVEQEQWADADAELRAAEETFRAGGAEGPRRELVVVRSEMHRRQGRLDEALEDIAAAVALAERGGDDRAKSRLRAERAILLAATGKVGDATVEAAKIAPSSWAALEPRTRARVHLQIAFAALRSGDAKAAEDRARDALKDAGEPGSAQVLEAAQKLVVQILLDTDRRGDAEAFVVEQGLKAEAVDDALAARRELDLYNEGVDAYNGGDYPAAVDAFRAVADGGDDGDPRRVSAAKNLLSALLLQGGARRDAGDGDGARAAYDEAAERGWAAGRPEDAARALMALSEIRTEAGAVDDAVGYASRAAEASIAAEDDALQGRAWMTLGDAHYDSDAEEAAASYKRALTTWGDTAETASEAATVSYNLAVLLAGADTPEALRLLERSATLAAAAGDPALARQAKDAIAQLSIE